MNLTSLTSLNNMANKNTLRTRRTLEKANKRGHAVNTNNGGRFQPKLTKEDQDLVEAIQKHTRKLYLDGL